MNFDNIIKERYSVRIFEDKVVDDKIIDQILDCGRLAPSACGNNSVTVYVLKEEQIEKVKEATKYTFGVKNMFVICYDKNEVYERIQDNSDYGKTDASIVTTIMMLKITELGLGSCWVGAFEDAALSRVLELEENMMPVALLPFGYISEKSVPSKRHEIKKTIEEFAIKM